MHGFYTSIKNVQRYYIFTNLIIIKCRINYKPD